MLTQDWSIICYIIKNSIRKDFQGVEEQLREKLGLRLPYWINWTMVLLTRNILLLMLAIGLKGVESTASLWIISSIVLTFNFLLAGAMARRKSIDISQHPIKYVTHFSLFPLRKLILLWITAECMIFLLHEMMFIACGILVICKIAPTWSDGLLSVIGWIVCIVNIYIITLYKNLVKKWAYRLLISFKHEVFFCAKTLCATCISIYICVNGLLVPIIKETSRINIAVSNHFISDLSYAIKIALEEKVLAIWAYLSDNLWILHGTLLCFGLFLIARLLLFWVKPVEIQLSQTPTMAITPQTRMDKLYQHFAMKLFPNSPWIWRDLLIMNRLRSHWMIPLRSIVTIPPAMFGVIVFSIFMGQHLHRPYSIIIFYWFLGIIYAYQTSWIWINNYPSLHLSSEGRNIELLHFSPHNAYPAFIYAKWKTLTVLLLPLQILFNISFILVLSFSSFSLFHLFIGISGLWMILFIVSFLSIYWMSICSQYDDKSIFNLQIESYEQKIIHQLYKIPKLILTYIMLSGLVVVLFSNHDNDLLAVQIAFLALTLMSSVVGYLAHQLKTRTLDFK